ncbi:MAG TPA: hypothetical protein PLJ29_04380 [Leptospiraceae bacterium]|nr:hypothetical protein [Leptospiraceae bacterium]HNF23967.1 hypothetical protein [Leptospiraceae bacterium]HNH07109.1 hypothetical protein [Leptospiraceae bacterium]HNI25571.1 hypothetical protein [Leptospiraceae bacterium]HNM05372.1 hypothetical protein [Leptospiraceae bacterium]
MENQSIFKSGWIVSRNYDLFFFIGSFLFALMFYGIYRLCIYSGLEVNGLSILVTYFIFTAVFDHPHIFQTFSRTHADGEEFARRPKTYTLGILAFIGAGFILTGLGYVKELIIFAAYFGSYHVIKQHYGFMRIYKARNGDVLQTDNIIDSLTFYSGMFACFFNNFTYDGKPVLIYGDLNVVFPGTPDFVGETVWMIFKGSAAVFVLRQIQLVISGKQINLPKILLMSSALFIHYFVFFATETAFLVAESIETAFHAVQYQGWMMHFQEKRYPNARKIALKWFLVSLLYGVTAGVIEIYGLLSYVWAVWLFVPFSMLILFHYFIDGYIWKFRDYPELGKLLLSGSSPSAESVS